MRIGIIGAGHIADTVTGTLVKMPEAECYAIAARDLKRAEAFRDKFGFEKAYGSYEEMLADEKVQLVYIATPHSLHAEHMRFCIRYKKPFLCEKAFAMNAQLAQSVLREAESAGVFGAEAIWTRYMPSRAVIREAIDSGIVGPIHMLTANLSYQILQKPRISDPALCGGALLDVGVYPLNFAVMCFGEDIERIESSCRMTDRGVDECNTMTLFYKDGRTAVCVSGTHGRSDRLGVLYGENGYIVVENINDPSSVKAYGPDDRLLKEFPIPPQISGYEYEFTEAFRSIEAGLLEAPSMKHGETLFIMKLMDAMRAQWGMVYPMEK